MKTSVQIGRVLRANTSEFVVGCRVGRTDSPGFGSLVAVATAPASRAFGLIYDVRIEDDGLIRQLVTTEAVTDEVVQDNRERRIVPVEVSAVTVGFEQDGIVQHQLPPRPPVSLDLALTCDPDDVRRFTSSGRFAYLRHLVRRAELPLSELIAAHIRQARAAHPDPDRWSQAAVAEVISLFRDDYLQLSAVLAALEHDPSFDSR